MFNKTEAAERAYLKKIIGKLEGACRAVDDNLSKVAKELQEQKSYLYENKTGMDAAEKASVKQSVNMQAISGEAAAAYKVRLQKLKKAPYFGRIDFRENGKTDPEPVYVGMYAFLDEKKNQYLIHDWRAPVSGMFYDFEPGRASFESPSGTKEGDIVRKRQYRIVDGEMEMMLESDFYIRDDVLQKELSRSADDKMKNIVATIQRDQNAIIRDETSETLIIQGAAGSGKTSIALHRIAFLLYRFKDTIRSKDIMIISPNKVFSDYISNVLPELGEETIPEMEMESLAVSVLGNTFRFQSFFDQVNRLLETHEEDVIRRIEFKATPEFLHKLTSYANWLKRDMFREEELKVRYKTIPKQYLRSRYEANNNIPLMKRHRAIASDVFQKITQDFRYDLRAGEKAAIRKQIKEMVGGMGLREMYENFYEWLGRPDMFQYDKGKIFEYADMFPLIYMNMLMNGADAFRQVKHLIVDEMQDYTAVQYAVLARLFPCNKTILGDANQNVNPYSSTTSAQIKEIFPSAQAVTLLKSYRSTLEISEFSKRISPNVDVEPVERHGEPPHIREFEKTAEEKQAIRELLDVFSKSDYQSLGILCKTQKQAKKLYASLKKHGYDAWLLSPDSFELRPGIIITSAHLAKGLEFDQVIIPHVNQENFVTEVDRSMLYIACTRAMHHLTLTSTGPVSDVILA